MPNSKQIVYLSQAQYAELITNGTITVNGVTVTYDENDIYVTPQAEPVTDVRINGTSVAANGVADIPIATSTTPGVIKPDNGGTEVNQYGQLVIRSSPPAYYKYSTGNRPITASMQPGSVFWGLAKASGDNTQANSDNDIGNYTPEAKAAIQQMLGVSDLLAPRETSYIASQAYAVGDIFTLNGKLYKVTTAIAESGAIVVQDDGETVSGANAIQCRVEDGFVKKTNYATNSVPGIVKTNPAYGTQMFGDVIATSPCNDNYIKLGTHQYNPIVSATQHKSVFYGLAKAAGDTTQSQSSNAVGTYTDEAKAAIKGMIGVNVDDVQIDGTSIVSSGIANVPIGGANTLGVARNGSAVKINDNGQLYIYSADAGDCRVGTSGVYPLTPKVADATAFFGLAKAAGDTTQVSQPNNSRTYTDNAKASIKSMLGIVDGSTSTVSVTGTTPSITAVENTRYTCGEVSTLTITPPVSGICIIRFTSGTTPTVLTATGVVWPAWFDATDLEADTTYEICITDGYGAVMTWPL